MTTPTNLKELHQSMTDDQFNALSSMRGGCSCHLSAPCHNCVEPLTMDEAEELGLLPGEDEKP